VTAVLGNNDAADVAAWGAPETTSLEAEGLRIAMIHDSGPSAGRLARMQRRFPDSDLVVFGHSHIPLDEATADGAFRIFNPGSPTDRRRQPHGTIGLLEIADGTLKPAQIIPVT
jgi:predicted phosphodiesterase